MPSRAADLHARPSVGGGRRLRVLVVGPVSGGGGLARVARMSTEGFDPRRFEISICDTTKGQTTQRSLLDKVRAHTHRLGRLIHDIRTHKPHLVHLHTCSYGTFFRTLIDGLACIVLRRRFVLHVHGGLFAEFLSSLRGLRRAAAFWFLRRADAVVLLSESWRTNLTRIAAGLRIQVIPNAVEPPVLHAADVPRGGGIVFLGDLGETKRPEDLLVAYAALPSQLQQQFALTLIGGGEPDRRALIADLSERLGIASRVTLRGAIPHSDAQRVLARADLFVLPSRAEGMPVALLEALAAGTPAIATRVGAVAEVVRDGIDALLVEPLDAAGLAQTMKMLLEQSKLRTALGKAGSERVQHDFAPKRFRAQLAELWTALAPAERPRRVELPRLATPGYRTIR